MVNLNLKILGVNNRAERQPEDYYATDPKALEIMLDALEKDGVVLHRQIWECACGEGHLSKVLISRGYDVHSSDLINRGYGEGGIDFLSAETELKNFDILTNPPYSKAKEFIEKGMELIGKGCHLVMFLKIQFLEGKARREMFKKYPPKYVYVNSTRQKCAKNGEFELYKNGTAVCYCWYIWEKGFNGEPVIRWL